MRYKEVVAITTTLADTVYPVADFLSPFTRGREVVLAVLKDGDLAGGDLHIETDNSSDGTYSDVRAAADADAATTQMVEVFNVTLGDNLRIGYAAITAGGCQIVLLGDT